MSLNLFAHAKAKFKSFINLYRSPIIKDESKFLVALLGASGKIGEGLLQYSIISINDEDPKFENDLIYPLAKDHHHPSSICNGLLLLLAREKGTKPPGEVLWNPTTGQVKTLPPAPSSFDSRFVKMFHGYFGFGFDSASEDYKVIRLLKERKTRAEDCAPTVAVMAELYSLRTNSWKRVSVVHPLRIPRHSGVHVNGTYYWLNQSDPWFIVSFDFATEKFASSVIPAPPSDKFNERNGYYIRFELVEYCGLLGAMIKSYEDTSKLLWILEIWVWDGSWSLVSSLTLPLAVGLYSLVGTDKLIYLGLNAKMMLFDCATSKLETIRGVHTPLVAHIFPFVESYVPLNG